MGLLLGKIKLDGSFVVLDSLSLPVEGTETRVNAQQQGYEFMITFLSNLKLSSFNYNVIGWYHSHPNYGCWLSGIDVQTQQLNQRHQDPFVAVVIDPIRSIKEKRLVIDAFRTLPQQQENENSNNTAVINTIKKPNKLPQNKEHEFGIHTKKYYQLDINYFESSIDRAIIKSSTINNKNWNVFFSHNNNQGNHHLQKEFDKLNTKFKDLAQRSVRNPKKEFRNELDNLMTLSKKVEMACFNKKIVDNLKKALLYKE